MSKRKPMKFELTELAKKAEILVNAGEFPNDLADKDNEVGIFVSKILTGSDDFFYSLTNGYVNYKSLIANKDQIKEVEKAIEVLFALEEVVRNLGAEF